MAELRVFDREQDELVVEHNRLVDQKMLLMLDLGLTPRGGEEIGLMSLCVTQGQGNVIVASRGFGDHPCPPSAPGRHSRFSLWDGSEESKPSDRSLQLGAPAVQRGAHFAIRTSRGGRWPIASMMGTSVPISASRVATVRLTSCSRKSRGTPSTLRSRIIALFGTSM